MPSIWLRKNLYFLAFIYFLVSVFFHWRLSPDISIILYLVGAVIGLHLFEMVEKFVVQGVSPLRNALTYLVVTILTVFVLTSTGNVLGKGVVLFLNLYLLFTLHMSFLEKKTLGDWFGGQAAYVSFEFGRKAMFVTYIIFALETLLFALV